MAWICVFVFGGRERKERISWEGEVMFLCCVL
jgi:hypothetical protein